LKRLPGDDPLSPNGDIYLYPAPRGMSGMGGMSGMDGMSGMAEEKRWWQFWK
jgi:hypothetical protein